jgi:hypothetical protein
LRPLGWNKLLAAALPQRLPASNNHLLPLEKALAFMHGLLCDARKLTHVAYLRRDPVGAGVDRRAPGGQSVGALAVLSGF